MSQKCEKCGKEMVVRTNSKTGNKFLGCSGFPGCRNIQPYIGEVKISARPLKSIPNPSHYQKSIFDGIEKLVKNGLFEGKTNLKVEAGAGSGKTSVEEHVVGLIKELDPGASIIYLVYNKHVEVDATSKSLPAKTTHSKFFSDLRNYLGYNPKIEPNKVQLIAKDLIKDDEEKWMVGIVADIVGKLKNTLAPWDDNSQEKICERFGIEVNGSGEKVFELVRQTLTLNNQNLKTIDFDDQMYLVWLKKMPVQQYKWVLGDECFPYKVPVLMENGIGLSIGKIVEEKIQGNVLTYNTETGKQEYKKIVGWHKLPNSKQLVKILALQHVSCMGGYRAWVTCTIDHKIFTKEDGWVEAGKLITGYHHIQGETSAKTNQAYKITDKGKRTLSKTITKNNQLKKTGNLIGFHGTFTKENRGGNGNGLTEPQKIYLERLGEGWVAEYLIKPTKSQRLEYKTATCYKIDVANPQLKIAIELDSGDKTK